MLKIFLNGLVLIELILPIFIILTLDFKKIFFLWQNDILHDSKKHVIIILSLYQGALCFNLFDQLQGCGNLV